MKKVQSKPTQAQVWNHATSRTRAGFERVNGYDISKLEEIAREFDKKHLTREINSDSLKRRSSFLVALVFAAVDLRFYG